jgi:hypothetical protein
MRFVVGSIVKGAQIEARFGLRQSPKFPDKLLRAQAGYISCLSWVCP